MKKAKTIESKEKQVPIEWEVIKKLAKLFFLPIVMVIAGFATYYLISVYFNLHWTIGYILGFVAYFLVGTYLFPEMSIMYDEMEENLKRQKYSH